MLDFKVSSFRKRIRGTIVIDQRRSLVGQLVRSALEHRGGECEPPQQQDRLMGEHVAHPAEQTAQDGGRLGHLWGRRSEQHHQDETTADLPAGSRKRAAVQAVHILPKRRPSAPDQTEQGDLPSGNARSRRRGGLFRGRYKEQADDEDQ